MEQKEVRLNKYISESGICSRREADRLIEGGKVLVNGNKADMGMKVTGSERITVNGQPINKRHRDQKEVLIAFNKPRGIVCTAKSQDASRNVIEYINYPKRLFYVGRLDKDSEGLLILTNNGDLANQIQKARNNHEKEYIVTVGKAITKEFIEKMKAGVMLTDLGEMTRPCKARQISSDRFSITLTQGLNRQIRRMCEELGYKVVKLERIRVMNIQLGQLQAGKWRYVTAEEERELKKRLKEQNKTRTKKSKA